MTRSKSHKDPVLGRPFVPLCAAVQHARNRRQPRFGLARHRSLIRAGDGRLCSPSPQRQTRDDVKVLTLLNETQRIFAMTRPMTKRLFPRALVSAPSEQP